MTNKFDNITELLPEGLTEATVSQIAELVDSVISEQVEEKVKELEAKVQGFLRLRVDEVKDHAMKELELENDTYKNAKLFESIKTLMAIELGSNDEDSAVGKISGENVQLEEEVDVLTEELKAALTENSNLETTIYALSGKIDNLEETERKLQGKVEYLEEAKEKPFKSSEKAVVISENNDEPRRISENEFLSEDIMKYMPFN